MVENDASSGNAAFKVNSLTNLDSARPDLGDVVWDGPRSIWNTSFLLGALILGPLTFSWDALRCSL